MVATKQTKSEELEYRLGAAQSRIGDLEATIRQLSGDLKSQREQANALRDQLHDSEMETARLRGYLQGLEDSQPPRMVPEPRVPQIPAGSSYLLGSEVGHPRRRWYHV